MTEGLTCVGAIAGAFGVKGEVRLKSFCADPAAIAGYGPLVSEDGRSFDVRLLRPIQGAFAARLTGIATREEAEALKGTRLYAPRDRLPPLGDDEYYHADLIGLAVVDAGGAPLGTRARRPRPWRRRHPRDRPPGQARPAPAVHARGGADRRSRRRGGSSRTRPTGFSTAPDRAPGGAGAPERRSAVHSPGARSGPLVFG